MQSFKDTNGRSWLLSIDVAAAKRVRALVGVDLYKLVDDGASGLADLLADAIKLVDVLYVLVKDQADKLSVSDEDFGRAFSGDVLEQASNAFTEELINFFPKERAKRLRLLLEKSRGVAAVVVKKAAADLESLDVEQAAQKFIASFGSSPDNSALTRDPLRSANSAGWPSPATSPTGT